MFSKILSRWGMEQQNFWSLPKLYERPQPWSVGVLVLIQALEIFRKRKSITTDLISQLVNPLKNSHLINSQQIFDNTRRTLEKARIFLYFDVAHAFRISENQ